MSVSIRGLGRGIFLLMVGLLVAGLGAGTARAETISVFELRNDTQATLEVMATRVTEGDAIQPVRLAPGQRRAIRLPVGQWVLEVRAIRVRGVDPVIREFYLPDEGPYGFAFGPQDFGVSRLDDGAFTALDPEDDTAPAAGLPPVAPSWVEAEYPVRRLFCTEQAVPAVNPYFALIPVAEACQSPWVNSAFQGDRRVCRMCPDGTRFDTVNACCVVE